MRRIEIRNNIHGTIKDKQTLNINMHIFKHIIVFKNQFFILIIK